ncbi:TRNA pseudouridine synthase A [Candidatus Vidania fulgoroideae]|nr:TRNA pseudouridine synthase A [Candidatus Vidania fulgoroideae]
MNFNLPRFGLINRLDRYSSGIIVFCRKKRIFERMLVEQKRKRLTKYYFALVKGFLKFKKKKVTCFLNGKKGCLFSFDSNKKYRFSETFFICLDKVYLNNESYSLFKCVTKTGRYHQIRKHLKILKLCLYKDSLYDRKEKKNDFFLNLYSLKYKNKRIITDFRFFLIKFYFKFNFRKKIVLK